MTLLDRDRELAALDEHVLEAAAGAGRLVLIEGPAGIGKSGLLAGLRERARPRLAVLSARHPASATASSRRDRIPSLRYALERWTSTVFGVT